MIGSLDAVTHAMAGLGLDMLWQRHQLIAANIANHATPGYQPLELDFDTTLSDLAGGGGEISQEEALGRLAWARGSAHVVQREGNVELDREMVDLTSNTLHYQALLSAIERFGSIRRLAVEGGTR
jgi:flagellar basal-body rod protein FlgB